MDGSRIDDSLTAKEYLFEKLEVRFLDAFDFKATEPGKLGLLEAEFDAQYEAAKTALSAAGFDEYCDLLLHTNAIDCKKAMEDSRKTRVRLKRNHPHERKSQQKMRYYQEDLQELIFSNFWPKHENMKENVAEAALTALRQATVKKTDTVIS